MIPEFHIRHLKRHEIDPSRWDDCVRHSANGWLYLHSFYLDAWGPWEGLVATNPEQNDKYLCIMPLPKRTKFGIPYTYIPPLFGQLGIAGRIPVTAAVTNAFLSHIPRSYGLVHTPLNEGNAAPTGIGVRVTKRTNLVLPLTEEYPILHSRFNADAKKNLRQAYARGLYAETGIDVEWVVRLYQGAYEKKNTAFGNADYLRMIRVCRLCIERGHGFTLGIRDSRQTLQAAGFFGLDERRIYYLLGAPGREGRHYNAVHCLIDQVIQKWAGSALELDFEGSDIPSVAAFYRKFAPIARSYYEIRFNRFPRWLQWLPGLQGSSPPGQDRTES
jgi:hypothetical protein